MGEGRILKERNEGTNRSSSDFLKKEVCMYRLFRRRSCNVSS